MIMEYEASGEITARNNAQKFCTKVEAKNEALAREKVYAMFGSKQGLKRKDIQIREIKVKK